MADPILEAKLDRDRRRRQEERRRQASSVARLDLEFLKSEEDSEEDPPVLFYPTSSRDSFTNLRTLGCRLYSSQDCQRTRDTNAAIRALRGGSERRFRFANPPQQEKEAAKSSLSEDSLFGSDPEEPAINYNPIPPSSSPLKRPCHSKMPKSKRVRDEEETNDYASDGGFVEDDEGPRSKKAKKVKPATKVPSSAAASDSSWELTGKRRVTISEFNKTTMINIREYYEKDGEFLPGKKGISLKVDQWVALLKAAPQVNAALTKMGQDVGGTLDDDEVKAESKDTDEESNAPKKKRERKPKVTAKQPKTNIDATSDEDED